MVSAPIQSQLKPPVGNFLSALFAKAVRKICQVIAEEAGGVPLQFPQGRSRFVKEGGGRRLVRGNGIRGENVAGIFHRTGSNMGGDQLIAGRIVLIGSVVEKDDI